MAVKTRAAILAEIASLLADNVTGDISPADMRTVCEDLADSASIAGGDRFTSADQTITSGGTLTIAHGLSAAPGVVRLRLKCTTAEYGYSIGDIVIGDAGGRRLNHSGSTIWVDATNIYVQFGSIANVYEVNRRDATIGDLAPLTNANWKAIFIAEK